MTYQKSKSETSEAGDLKEPATRQFESRAEDLGQRKEPPPLPAMTQVGMRGPSDEKAARHTVRNRGVHSACGLKESRHGIMHLTKCHNMEEDGEEPQDRVLSMKEMPHGGSWKGLDVVSLSHWRCALRRLDDRV